MQMKTKHLGKNKRAGLFFKITLANTLIISSIFAIVSGVVISSFSSIAIEKEIGLNKEATKTLHDFTVTKYNRAYNLSNLMHTSNNIGELFSEISAKPEIAFESNSISLTNNYLMSVSSADRDISEYILVTNNQTVFSTSSSSSRVISPSFNYYVYEPIKRLLESDDNMYIYYDASAEYISKNPLPVITFAGKIYDPGRFPQRNVVGVYLMNVPVQYFSDSFENTISGQTGNLFITNKQSEIIYSSNQDYDLPSSELLQTQNAEVNSIGVGISGISIISVVSNEELMREIKYIMAQMILLLICSVIGIAVLTYFLLRVYSNRIKTIAGQMESITGGDLDMRIPINASDETGMLAQAFNTMCEKLDNYIKLNYEAEMKWKNAELNALQAQINPHFLYNTIESIRMKAITEKKPELAKMLSLLGNMFRWNMAFGDKIVGMEDEIDYISSYVQLQNFRFNDVIEISINLPDELSSVGIPKLILQPVVENAVLHGFKRSSKNKRIDIAVCDEEGLIVITVSNNGQEIPSAKLEELSNRLETAESSHAENIGLINANERIKLLFGAEYGIKIKNTAPGGVCVTISLPKMDKWEQTVKINV